MHAQLKLCYFSVDGSLVHANSKTSQEFKEHTSLVILCLLKLFLKRNEMSIEGMLKLVDIACMTGMMLCYLIRGVQIQEFQ